MSPSPKRRVQGASVALLVAAAALAAGPLTWAAADQATPAAESVSAFMSEPFVKQTGPKSLTVDLSADPRAAQKLAAMSDETLDGFTVQIEGIDVQSASERRATDSRALATAQEAPAQLCAEIPTGERSADGATAAYLGCDPITGKESWGASESGDAGVSLGRALDTVLAHHFPDASIPATKVTSADGAFTVSFAPEAGEIASASSDGNALYKDLLFTAYSNGAVDNVTYTLDGDCRAWAQATGGDMCSVISLPIVLR